MKLWKDQSGKWITGTEFIQRYKQGISKVTPLQQSEGQLFFTYITLIGMLCGIVMSIFAWSKLWWVVIILVAGLGNTIIGGIGIYQKVKILRQHDAMFKQAIAKSQQANPTGAMNYAG